MKKIYILCYINTETGEYPEIFLSAFGTAEQVCIERKIVQLFFGVTGSMQMAEDLKRKGAGRV